MWFGQPGGLRPGPRWGWAPEYFWGPRTFLLADLDGDGRQDVLRSETTERDGGQVQLYLTSELRGDSWAPTWTLVPEEYLAVVGATLLELGDGGEPELALFASGCGTGACPMELQFYDDIGAPDGPTLVDSTRISGEAPLLANAGDLDGDGDDELFVGFERLYPPGGVEVRPDLAASWRHYRVMEADPASGEVWTEVGPQPDVTPPSGPPLGDEEFLGAATGATGDFDGNGVVDLAVAISTNAGGPSDIQLWLYGPEVEHPVPHEAPADTGLETGPQDTGAVGDTADPAPVAVPVASLRSPAGAGCAGSAAIGLLAVTGLARRRSVPVVRPNPPRP